MPDGAHTRDAMNPLDAQITIRPAYGDDDRALPAGRAGQRRGPSPAPLLVAEVDGELRAAVSLTDAARSPTPSIRAPRWSRCCERTAPAAGVYCSGSVEGGAGWQPGLARG